MVMSWRLEIADQTAGRLKRYSKKHPVETKQVFKNLDRFLVFLNKNDLDPNFVTDFVRQEKGGLIAADTRGLPKSAKRETRLYVYPMKDKRILRVLRIGDKDTQSDDIRECRKLMQKL